MKKVAVNTYIPEDKICLDPALNQKNDIAGTRHFEQISDVHCEPRDQLEFRKQQPEKDEDPSIDHLKN